MKRIIKILGIGFLLASCGSNYSHTTFLDVECPAMIIYMGNLMHLSDMSCAELETGNDTLSVYFGEFKQEGKPGYWIALFNRDNFISFEVRTPEELQEKGIIDIDFDNSTQKISFHVEHESENNQVKYNWLYKGKRSSNAYVEYISKALENGNKFPNIELQALTGKMISTDMFRGKYLVINWWATTCGPCKSEIPGLNQLVQKYKSHEEIVFLAICFDSKDRLQGFINEREFHYVQTLADDKTAELFGESFPKNLIVDPNGIIVYYSEGGNENTYLDIEKELIKSLKY